MKKEVCKVVLAFILFALLLGFAGYTETHYKREGEIYRINKEEISVIDTCGEEWCFEGSGYKEGDKVIMTMHTNNTNTNIYDDEIIKVKLQK